MKRIAVGMACIFALSLLGGNISAQLVPTQQEQTINSDDNERIQALILRYTKEWSAAGYSWMSYTEFQYKPQFSDEMKAHFHQSFLRYANKEYGGENTTFVIYKQVTGGVLYELYVIEDTAGQAFPNRYVKADEYFLH